MKIKVPSVKKNKKDVQPEGPVFDMTGSADAAVKGHGKGNAVDRMLQYLGLTKDDAYGFGDSTNDIEMFSDGLVLTDGLECLPADLKILSVSEDEYTSEAEITIREGKFHQVKRMFSSIGAEVLYLIRLSMGPVVLDPELPPGGSRRLTQDGMALLGL